MSVTEELPTESLSRTRRLRLAVFFLKLTVAVGLSTWLVRSGVLNFKALALLWTSPAVAGTALFSFVVGPLVFSALRWRLFLSSLGVRLSFQRTLGLQLIALFFNFFVPGNVSGDLIKNHAVVGRGDAGRMVAVALLERVMGLIGLVWTAVPALIFAGGPLMRRPAGIQLMIAAGTMALLSIVGLGVARWLLVRLTDAPLGRNEERSWIRRVTHILGRQLSSGAATLRSISDRPQILVQAFVISLCMHFVGIFYFWVIARHLGNPEATFLQMALVYPIGILSIAIPVSVSGMGVGHLLFNELFEMLGLVRGADVFNLHIFSGLLLSLSGVLPYLLMKVRQATTGSRAAD